MDRASQPAGLRTRVLGAGLWTLTGYSIETLIRLASTLIMTRLLVPEAFGLMAVALSIPAGLILLSDVGIRSNVIRKSSALGSDFLHTAWTIQVIRGALLWGLALVVSALLVVPQIRLVLPPGSILADAQLPILLAVIGCLPAIAGWDSVNLFVQERDIKFKSLVMRTIASKAAALPVMLAWAALDRSVWALAAGAISAQLVLAISSHFMVPGGPMKLSWNTTHIRDIFGDGKWITLSSAAGIVSSQGDRLVLAAILTAQQMGLYAVAWALAEVLRAFVQRLDGQITLPVLSELYRTKPAAAKAAYYRYRMPIDIFTFGAAAFLCFAGSDIVDFLYDDRYRGAGWVLQVLGLSLAPIPFRVINQAFIANDEWRGFSMNSAFLSVSLVGAIAAGYYFAGWPGAVWGVALHSWPATLTLLVRAHRRGWIDPLREISMIPAALLGLTLGLVAHWVLPWAGALI